MEEPRPPTCRPVSVTQVDASGFLRSVKEELGRDVARSADRAGLDPRQTVANIFFIESLCGRRTQLADVSASTLEHFHFGFTISASRETVNDLLIYAAENSLQISVATEKTFLVLTGNLENWRRFIIDCDVSFECRTIMNMLFSFFEMAHLEDLWSAFSKQSLEDGTFQWKKKK